MSSTGLESKHIESLQEQHSEIRKLTEVLTDPQRKADRRELLSRLHTLLARHFALEESKGYLAEELAIAPQLSHVAEGLRKEHEQILARVKKLEDSSRAGSTTDALVQAIDEAVSQLRDHESAENRLVQQALLDDEGGG